MAKEIPYFRFTVTEWMNDDISFMDYETKGVFADVCAYYWFKDCSLTEAKLKRCFSNASTQLEQLFNEGIIKRTDDSDLIEITFLNEQYDKLSKLRKTRQEAGSKGGKQTLSKPQAKSKQTSSYKDKDKEKDKDNIPFDDFWQKYPNKKGKSEAELLWNGTKNLNNGNKITNKERRHILKILSEFAAEQKDLKFTPHAMTFLRQRKFEDYTAKTTEDLQRDEYKRRGLIWRPGTKQHGLKV